VMQKREVAHVNIYLYNLMFVTVGSKWVNF
jgi:hypothetical protein